MSKKEQQSSQQSIEEQAAQLDLQNMVMRQDVYSPTADFMIENNLGYYKFDNILDLLNIPGLFDGLLGFASKSASLLLDKKEREAKQVSYHVIGDPAVFSAFYNTEKTGRDPFVAKATVATGPIVGKSWYDTEYQLIKTASHPSLKMEAIQGYTPGFVTILEQKILTWQESIRTGEALPTLEAMQSLTLDAVVSTILGGMEDIVPEDFKKNLAAAIPGIAIEVLTMVVGGEPQFTEVEKGKFGIALLEQHRISAKTLKGLYDISKQALLRHTFEPEKDLGMLTSIIKMYQSEFDLSSESLEKLVPSGTPTNERLTVLTKWLNAKNPEAISKALRGESLEAIVRYMLSTTTEQKNGEIREKMKAVKLNEITLRNLLGDVPKSEYSATITSLLARKIEDKKDKKLKDTADKIRTVLETYTIDEVVNYLYSKEMSPISEFVSTLMVEVELDESDLSGLLSQLNTENHNSESYVTFLKQWLSEKHKTQTEKQLAQKLERLLALLPQYQVRKLVAYIAQNIRGFYNAGFETTSATATWVLMNARRNMAIHAQMLKEGEAFVSETANNPALLSNISYLKDLWTKYPATFATYRETLRLYPPMPGQFRVMTADATVEVNGTIYTANEGDILFPMPLLMNLRAGGSDYDPMLWVNEKEGVFYAKEASELPEIKSFGVEDHHCLGNALADVESMITVLTIYGKMPDLKIVSEETGEERFDYKAIPGMLMKPPQTLMTSDVA